MNDERRAELDRLLAQSDSLIADFFRSTPEPPDDLEDLLDDSRADAAARLDPSLSGLRNSQYVVRIRRDSGDDLDIDGASVREIMAGIEHEVDVAAPTARGEARIELESLTRGSVVLHYRAVKPLDTVAEGEFDHGLSVVDGAITLVSEVHRAFEARLPVAQIVQLAKRHKGLLEASKAVLDTLQKHDLNLSTRWRDYHGARVTSRLGDSAKAHAAEIFDKQPKDERIFLSGSIIEMSIKGGFTLQASRQYVVAPSDEFAELIRRGDVHLGEFVSLELREEKSHDKAGLESKPQYRFVRVDDRLTP